jgi:hypothetical protein
MQLHDRVRKSSAAIFIAHFRQAGGLDIVHRRSSLERNAGARGAAAKRPGRTHSIARCWSSSCDVVMAQPIQPRLYALGAGWRRRRIATAANLPRSSGLRGRLSWTKRAARGAWL